MMGDKSPKSKQRNQKQKNTAQTDDRAKARSKQQGFSNAPALGAKGKK
jgi:hypothetical protein